MRYSHILENWLIPAYYGLRGRTYPRRRELMERSQWWSPEQMQEFQWRELQSLLQHAFHAVPYYRRKYAAAGIELGDIKTRADFAKLPPLTRKEVADNRLELCGDAIQRRLIPHATGGSSGIPTRFYITLDSYDWRCAASARAYSWSGYRTGDRVLYLWGSPVGRISPLKRAKLDLYRFLRNELVIPTFVQTTELWQNTYRSALRFRPRFVVGYVSSLEQFAKFLLARDLRISSIQAVLAAAEPVYPATRDLVSRAFGAPLFDTYGSREFMSIAAECEHRQGLHIHSENLLVETGPVASDDSAELLVTDLHNYGMPFIRYGIGDLGLMSNSNCACGRGLPLISRVQGRVLEVLRTRDGRTIPGEFFPHLLKDIAEVREYQIRQSSLDEIVVSLVLAQPLSQGSETLLRREMAKVFTPATRVTIKPVEAIPQLPSGKRKLVVGIGQLA